MKLMDTNYQRILGFLVVCLTLTSVTVKAQMSDSRIRNSDQETVYDLLKLTDSMQNQQVSTRDVQKYVPTSFQSGTSDVQVARGIMDQSLQTWFNSNSVKNSSLGRAATQVQNNMSLDTSAKTGTGLAQIEHKFSMQLLAFQASAKFEYTGYVTAKVNHSMTAQQTDVELSEKILSNKSLFLNHSIKSYDRLSTLGLKWNF